MKEKIVEFNIERLDSLGQGVSKVSDKITFIPKTLPGEKGLAKVTGSKKGVQFAQVMELKTKSELRIEAECPHFESCSGCDYLHMGYDQEILNKQISMERLLKFSPFEDITLKIHRAPSRFSYRNRIQLHYDLKSSKLGFFTRKGQRLVEVPHCKIPLPEIQTELEHFYNDWKNQLPPNAPSQGHVELYLINGKVQKTWNQTYSSGGFSQVNQTMNLLSLEIWNNFYESCGPFENVADIFGGSGNLSREFANSQVTVIDSYCDETKLLNHQRFKKQDLYKQSSPPKEQFELLLFDPPRSGFKELSNWVQELNPRYVGYQSCFSDTLFRDLKNLGDSWEIIEGHLLDFFPGTHHYESIIILKQKHSK